MILDELKEKYGKERVLCIDNRHLNSWNRTIVNEIEALEKAVNFHGYFDYRYNAEINYNAKQLIPYVVLKQDGKLYVTKRLQGDSRLVGSSSVAVGGHVDNIDIANSNGKEFFDTLVKNCIARELQEELNGLEDLDLTNYRDYMKCTFIDEGSDVSKVHVCLLVVIELDKDKNISIKETDKLDGEWVSMNDIDVDSLEGWSRIAYKILIDEEPLVEYAVTPASTVMTKTITTCELKVDSLFKNETVEETKPKKTNKRKNTKKDKGE